MWFLSLACAFFLGLHLLTPSVKLKDQIIEGIGPRSYRALFALLSVFGLLWMILAYFFAISDPLNLKLYDLPSFFRYVAILPMFVAFELVIIGALSPSPTGLTAQTRILEKPVVGIIRISRHPVLAGIAIYSLTHFLLVGSLAAWLFFGTLLVLAVLGAYGIDRKREAQYGEIYQSIKRRTSFVPFNALLEGRTIFVPDEIGVVKPILALSMFCVFLSLHEMLFAVRVL